MCRLYSYTAVQAGIGENPAPGTPLALTSLRMALNFVKLVKLDGANPGDPRECSVRQKPHRSADRRLYWRSVIARLK
jgi:hypothetical protein